MHYKLKCSKKHCQIVSDCLNVEKSVVKTTSENKYEHNLWERNQNNNSEIILKWILQRLPIALVQM